MSARESKLRSKFIGRLKWTVASFIDSSVRRATIMFPMTSTSPVLEAIDRVHCTPQRTLSHRRLSPRSFIIILLDCVDWSRMKNGRDGSPLFLSRTAREASLKGRSWTVINAKQACLSSEQCSRSGNYWNSIPFGSCQQIAQSLFIITVDNLLYLTLFINSM